MRRMRSEMASKNNGFVFSLDLELFWGVRDHKSRQQYGRNILGVRQAVPAILQLFARHEIACTWAVVGMLFAKNKNKKDLLAHLPQDRPKYSNPQLDPYSAIAEIGNDEKSDPWHYGRSLIDLIRQVNGQEVGTHTFGHFNCLEAGATPQAFDADLESALEIMARDGIAPRSIVFPRNQHDDSYLDKCAGRNINVFRGNEKSWLYKSAAKGRHTKLQRALRLADAYLDISGANSHLAHRQLNSLMVDIPSSRFCGPGMRRCLLRTV